MGRFRAVAPACRQESIAPVLSRAEVELRSNDLTLPAVGMAGTVRGKKTIISRGFGTGFHLLANI